MKKHSFIESTVISTLSIIFIKILGMIYVIPFYAIVGVQGAALYAYAYNIYGLFLEIATAGIPNAIGKIINEYNTLNKQEAKVRAFKIGKRLLLFIAVASFLVMFIFAPELAKLILGDLQGGNTIEQVAFVIRAVSFSLLLFPFLSVTRGFFLGHKIVYVSSFSQVIEQVARVTFILGGSYIALKVLKLDLTHAVGISVFSAFVGGAFSLLYVVAKLRKNKEEFNLKEDFKEKDNITNKEIIKKIFIYAIPTVIISIAFSIYNNIDMILILRTMDHLGFEAAEVEFISTAISTWAPKISIIITSIGLGMAPGLVAAMVEAYTLKNYKEVNRKFNKALEITIFITIPMCVGISFLSSAIWTIFYGYNNFHNIGALVLMFGIFTPLFSNLYTICNFTLQSVNKFKMVYISAITGIVINTLLDVPLMLLFYKLGIPPYWGATLATIIGFIVTVLIATKVLKKEFNFKYKGILTMFGKTLIPLTAMIITVIILKILIPININNRMSSIIYVGIISIVGALVYFLIAYKMGLVDQVLGTDFLDKIKNKLKIKKKNQVAR